MKIYLAHPFDLRNAVREFDLFLRKEFGWDILNPFYDLNKPGVNSTYERGESLTQVQYGDIVRMDRTALDECDSMIAILESAALGTAFEVWDKFLRDFGGIYIITDSGRMNHPWLNYISQVSGIPLFGSYVDFYHYADKYMRK